MAAAPARIAAAEAALLATTDPAQRVEAQKAVDKARADLAAAEGKIAAVAGQTTSMVGLEAPLITLKNPGIISIPLGFLCVFLGSLLFREKRAEDMWEELYVRQNTGIHAEGASSH